MGRATTATPNVCRNSRRLAGLADHLRPLASSPTSPAPPSSGVSASASSPIFRHVNVDTDRYHRDGYMVFPAILTPEACANVLASCKAVQAKSDAIIMETDWNGLDWSAFGLPQLPKPVSLEQRQSLCGGCELSMSPPGSLFPPGWGASAAMNGPGRRFGALFVRFSTDLSCDFDQLLPTDFQVC